MKRSLIACLIALTGIAWSAESAAGWESLFDGKSLAGWKANESPETFRVENGELVVKGTRAHLFYVGPVQNHSFKNFEFEAEVLTRPKANSGVYFHTELQDSGWPSKGYEVQVNNTHRDPKKTAGLYGIKDNFEAPAKDDEWFTLSIKVEGKRVITKVNGRLIVDFTEGDQPPRPGRTIGSGTFALQGHDPESEVRFRKTRVRPLP
ncbi:MAG: DUF1080 domain-containing protein [Chthoniobacteraceae bacterium]